MGIIEDYNEKIELITAIPNEELTTAILIPIGLYIQEAENLYKWCQEDKALLTAKGLQWAMVDDIPKRAGALREAESRWTTQRLIKKEAAHKGNERSPEVYELRTLLIHEFRFAYRKNSPVLNIINSIAGSQTYAERIQDLNNLSVLGKSNPAELKIINFDTTLLERAAELAEEVAAILATARTESDTRSAKLIRDQAITYLKQAFNEVCEVGQYVFWKNPERKYGYSSTYLAVRMLKIVVIYRLKE